MDRCLRQGAGVLVVYASVVVGGVEERMGLVILSSYGGSWKLKQGQ